MTDIAALKSKITDSGFRVAYIAKWLNLTPAGLYKKLAGGSEFNAREMTQISDLLRLSDAEKISIFFAHDVDK